MVDADAAGVAERGAQGLDEGPVLGLAKTIGTRSGR
jgi:hypothetical protein